MAVDLSQVGLTGIRHGQQTLDQIAARRASESAVAINEAKEAREAEEVELNKLAANNARRIMAGEGRAQDVQAYTEEDSARFLNLVGNQLIAAGATKRGSEMIAAGIDIEKKRSEITEQEGKIVDGKLARIEKAGKYMYEAFSDAQNENEYYHALRNLPPEIVEILGEDNVETLRNTPWTPELQAYFRDQALSTYQQATLDMQRQNAERADRRVAQSQRVAEGAQAIALMRHKESERHNRVMEKISGSRGKTATVPTNNEILAAKDVILSTVPNISGDAVGLDAAAIDIVDQAKRLVEMNRGTTMSEALAQATMQAMAAGDFGLIQDVNRFTGSRTTTDRYYEGPGKRRGATKANAMVLPTGDDAEQVREKLIPGRYYRTKAGVLKWNGTEFE